MQSCYALQAPQRMIFWPVRQSVPGGVFPRSAFVGLVLDVEDVEDVEDLVEVVLAGATYVVLFEACFAVDVSWTYRFVSVVNVYLLAAEVAGTIGNGLVLLRVSDNTHQTISPIRSTRAGYTSYLLGPCTVILSVRLFASRSALFSILGFRSARV